MMRELYFSCLARREGYGRTIKFLRFDLTRDGEFQSCEGGHCPFSRDPCFVTGAIFHNCHILWDLEGEGLE